MIIVIIAGGSGTRLWPLSTPEFPKHLLTIGDASESILQATYQRARRLTDKIYVVSEKSHSDHVNSQLKGIDEDRVIVEPARRGTANCIVAALAILSRHEDPNEPVAFIHADHYIRDVAGFANSFKLAAKVSVSQKRIALIGVEPTYPATGFGYIKKDGQLDEEHFVYKVNSFKEKPDFKMAQEYYRSGNYLWNCGYFVGSINTFKQKMKSYAPDLLDSLDRLSLAKIKDFNDVYLNLKDQAIDYALIEKVKDLLVIPAGFDWKDVGSFSDLSSVVESDESGNYMFGDVYLDEVNSSFIDNKEAKPVVVIGLDNVVVVNTEEGILVTNKDMSQKVGEIAKKIIEWRNVKE